MPNSKGFAADLYARFRAEAGRLSQTTIDWALDWYLANNRTLIDWYPSIGADRACR